MKANFIGQISFVLMILSSVETKAQLSTAKYEVGANIGTYVYMGDLAPNRFGSFRTIQPGVSLYGTRYLTKSWGVRANISFSRLKGDDAKYPNPDYRQQRNFNFNSNLFEVSAVAVWKPLADNYSKSGKGSISPYLFAGAGVGFVNIKRDWSNLNAAYFAEDTDFLTGLATDQAHRTPRIMPVIPIGAGVQYGLSDKWFLHLETTYRYTFTDYLDGFSRSANPSQKDAFYNISVGATYKFGRDAGWKCPPLRL